MNPDKPDVWNSNLGMYRIQLSGNDYAKDEIGLHYQIRRDIGIHHQKALQRGEPLRVSIFVGGPPAHTFAAVMYTPSDVPEILFAGALNGSGFRYIKRDGFIISADADFCITGYVDPVRTKPEGPFGDHLGYYSLKHEFPFLTVHKIYHRKNAIWPFTVVGRPPQEDTTFGKLIHDMAEPMIKTEIPGVKEVHAVDAAGVHPLLLAIGSERYAPYQKRKPQELLTLSNAILGYGPLSLAKYLFIVAGEDNPQLDTHDIAGFFKHVLERFDSRKDLHFQTMTTIDTLDYSGTGLNQGSKVVIAAAGEVTRQLPEKEPAADPNLGTMKMIMPGILALQTTPFKDYEKARHEVLAIIAQIDHNEPVKEFPLIILCDDAAFTAADINNFLWTAFTRSNPSHDIYGLGEFTQFKHWGCKGPLMIDARLKPHHAPPLEVSAQLSQKVDTLIESEPVLARILK